MSYCRIHPVARSQRDKCICFLCAGETSVVTEHNALPFIYCRYQSSTYSLCPGCAKPKSTFCILATKRLKDSPELAY